MLNSTNRRGFSTTSLHLQIFICEKGPERLGQILRPPLEQSHCRKLAKCKEEKKYYQQLHNQNPPPINGHHYHLGKYSYAILINNYFKNRSYIPPVNLFLNKQILKSSVTEYFCPSFDSKPDI